MQYKVAELDGAKLDAAVAKAAGEMYLDGSPSPAEEWCVGGPIIDRALIRIRPSGLLGPNGELMEGYIDDGERWFASMPDDSDDWRFGSKTPLIAAMRAYVASKLGEEVELP